MPWLWSLWPMVSLACPAIVMCPDGAMLFGATEVLMCLDCTILKYRVQSIALALIVLNLGFFEGDAHHYVYLAKDE